MDLVLFLDLVKFVNLENSSSIGKSAHCVSVLSRIAHHADHTTEDSTHTTIDYKVKVSEGDGRLHCTPHYIAVIGLIFAEFRFLRVLESVSVDQPTNFKI